MTKPLANKTKQREKTHRVVVEIDVNADSPDHAEMIVENSVCSSFHETNITDSFAIM